VHTENISAIKYTVLQHLPVFLQNTMAGESDSQLVNSVYLDNTSMELYHGRLDKTPGAIALRFRWYGTGTPDVVFVERKTHRESWMGEVSVKERFTVKENQVTSLLNGTFDVDAEVQRLQQKGKSEEAIREWFELATEVIQAINSKQLVPTMRTQYMRTAFQIPFDATVRVSLDTNLCMITERTKETLSGERWYRDPFSAVPLHEITRFPHGVLEVKLQLQDESKTPGWVTEMLESGRLLEVHKFSKFIHGGAVLMPDDVRSVPYWIDDVTLAESIRQSGSAHLLESSTGANEYYKHLLPHDKEGKAKQRVAPSRSEVADSSTMSAAAAIRRQQEVKAHFQLEQGDAGDVEARGAWWEDCMEWTQPMAADHVTGQKVGAASACIEPFSFSQ
jgi:SPX domain protein involved in polyphosphate accumulation